MTGHQRLRLKGNAKVSTPNPCRSLRHAVRHAVHQIKPIMWKKCTQGKTKKWPSNLVFWELLCQLIWPQSFRRLWTEEILGKNPNTHSLGWLLSLSVFKGGPSKAAMSASKQADQYSGTAAHDTISVYFRNLPRCKWRLTASFCCTSGKEEGCKSLLCGYHQWAF